MSSGFGLLAVGLLGLIVAGYIAQSRLPPPKPKIVGIDLGTTYSCIGAYEAITSKVFIFPNKHGKNTMPSIVSFTNEGVKVGQNALAMAEIIPRSTVYDAKRFIGKNFTQPEIDEISKLYQFKIAMYDNGLAYFKVDNKGLEREVTPEEIGSYIIKELVHDAQMNLSRIITKAVMSVPAEFDKSQREATKQAAKLAGIEVLRIINEPTAAALAYGLHEHSHINYVIVVDLGGGTLDVSLLNIQGGMFVTMAMAGNNRLGGQDFNNRLFHYILKTMKEKHGELDLSSEDLQRLQHIVESVKINLTTNYVVPIQMPLALLSNGGSIGAFEMNITRSTFEKLNHDLFEKSLDPLKKVLEVTELNKNEIDEIVLVGGSTRIPKIREIIKNFFDGKEPNVAIDPELAVATGVSIQAGILGGAWPLHVSAIEIQNEQLKKINV
ncbi:heat shock 70 kDa protein 13-like [Xenia sp. Carnegie-2017]|uniref:heat shock 70 kDa protein 13-like n=1 Tax=Xenia sp. Carnegie-2017 TaxID=2897299 RepID=UPI001F0477B9|nr:heat shock 70 kDa protein 13-like [Xenia sp. Carnegie-2017]